MIELLQDLIMADSPPGREDEVRKIILREMERVVDNIRVDALGNVIATRQGASDKTVLLIAHQDEDWVLLVTYIDEAGYLRFTRLVGHRWNLVGQRVNIHGKKGKQLGVVGLPAPHLIPVAQQLEGYRPEPDQMFIDCGARSAKDARSLGLEVGQYVTACKHFEELANGRLLGNCFDNRAGLVAMIEVLRRISKLKLDMNIVAVASVQEELGRRGAEPAAYAVNPDYAIALDVSPTGDHPSLKAGLVPVQLGQGPTLLKADQNHVTSQKLNSWIAQVAQIHGIPLQQVVLRTPVHFGTDASAVEVVKGGSHATALLVPTRYFHTTNSMIQHSDLEATIKLLVACLHSLDRLE
ncbi:MAG: M42 family metallopeptidase [Candidatus Thorarchaeota archaeon]